jgi:hypothetical protein
MDLDDPTSVHAEDAVRFASEILYSLSGEKYTGIQTTTEHYTSDTLATMQTAPVVVRGSIIHAPVQQGLRNLRLRHNPIRHIVSIEADGVELPADSYNIVNGSYLIRADRLPWILGVQSGLTVTYTHGSKIPAAGKIAAMRLANEYVLLKTGSDDCTLPSRISVSISRQGETISTLDPLSFLSDGKTGVFEVDLFLTSVNPTKAKKRSRVFSVDRPRGERLT